ncbi:MAG: Gfo/Idh/MocA family oxidoreductase [Actinomycetota bacterium]|nr:Gfo/Idh/MocA family oxidoreductase [Actinomycetota bacterium]
MGAVVGRGNKPLRVGIVGVGWGSVVQTPAFRMVPRFEVAALCSRRLERVQAAGEQLGIPDVSTDWRTFVQRADLDVISVATPVDLHHEITMAAIAAGKHVRVEKPLGLSPQQTGEMLAAAEAAGVAHAVCFEGRWEPARLKIWEMVRAGHLGQVYLGTGRTGADFWHPTRGVQSEWMYRQAEGGGYLMGMGSHDIDFMCALFGEPEAVCADVRTNVPQRTRPDGSVLDVDADDTAVLLLRMRNGMLVNILTTAIAYQRNFKAFEVYGSNGSITMDGLLMGGDHSSIVASTVGSAEPVVVAHSDRTAASGMEPPARRAGPSIASLALMLEDWLPAFDGQPTDVPTLVDGHRVQRIVDAARRSSAGEGWVGL